MDIIASLDDVRAANDMLEHPFYVRWVAGELSAQEIRRYAGEYRHAVRALADCSARAAACAGPDERMALSGHAREERDHVRLWESFAERAGCGASAARPPLPGTERCVGSWLAGADLLEHLAVLYAVEAGQPEVAGTKLEGLVAHYGYAREGPATEYFRLHAELDVEHAREAAALIRSLAGEGSASRTDSERACERARAALRGNWALLDGVQELAGVS